eukprot:1540316-Amphidinium_carterae.1
MVDEVRAEAVACFTELRCSTDETLLSPSLERSNLASLHAKIILYINFPRQATTAGIAKLVLQLGQARLEQFSGKLSEPHLQLGRRSCVHVDSLTMKRGGAQNWASL